MAEQLAGLKAQYQIKKNYFNAGEGEDYATEDIDDSIAMPMEVSR